MNHNEHVHLIKKGISTKGGVWADLGSGDGAFTLALRDLAGPESKIYSVDKDRERLKRQKEAFEKQFPHSHIQYIEQDFTGDLQLPKLDGLLMANSLHYVQDHVGFLTQIQKCLKPKGRIILVEYSIDTGNQWVPYPLSFPTFKKIAKDVGFKTVELLERIPSSYWEEMYSAIACR